MMQDWADRLDLLEQGKVVAANAHLIIRIDGMPVMDEGTEATGHSMEPVNSPVLVSSVAAVLPKRLSPVPESPAPVTPVEIAVSDFQRERLAMLEIYEAPSSLPVVQFAKLAGKSRDQINREIKAGKLLTLSMGNRGQRIPDWQLDPLTQELVRTVLQHVRDVDLWRLYRMLLLPRKTLAGQSAIAAIRPNNLHGVAELVSRDLSG
ncbi:hypothetical protein [Pseudomonas sp. NBRC 100443]|uniref:hypothetical protein n=1 Tax=Pseudomonas sp. NBRC 100443 TaxID=1113665 RepID=UPI0024A280B8|nr:hypothetical protein [Pseudomonas sp. NBRC 100443]GLU38375.1 hypothetical protein Pssp01_24680 [Pseudomonas sp. NBRC 100443]